MELMGRTDAELKKLARDFKIDTKGLNKMEIVEAIEKAHIKMKIELEAKARAELATKAARALGMDPRKKSKPSPETLAIQNSKRKYYVFRNQEEEGVKVTIRKGEKYRFEMHDGRIHCLPVWLVENLRKTATYPIYAQRKNPATGLEYSAHVGNRPRFGFDELEDAPEDTPFGVVIDHDLEKKHLPQPVLS